VIGQDRRIIDSLYVEYGKKDVSDEELMQILNDLAFYSTSPDSVLLYGEMLVKKASDASNQHMQFNGYIHMGNAHRLTGDYTKTFDAYFKSLKIAEEINDLSYSGISNTLIADTYSILGNTTNALKFYKKGIYELRSGGDEIEIGMALLNAGDEYLKIDKLDSARNFFLEASLIFHKNDYLIGKAYALGNIGLVYAREGKYSLAAENLKEATFILEKLGDTYAISSYQIHMAEVYLEKDYLLEALVYANIAHDYAEQEGLKEQIRDAAFTLSKIYEQMSDAGQALDYLKTYLAYRDTLKNEKVLQRMADLRREY
jgi:hypothetical protein